MKYWLNVFSIAMSDALKVAGGEVPKVVATLIGVGVAAFILGYLTTPEKGQEKIWYAAIYVLVVWLILAPCYFLVFVVRTCSSLASEATNQRNELSAKNEMLTADNRRLASADPQKLIQRDAIDEFINRMESVKVGFTNLQVASLGTLHTLNQEIKNYIAENFRSFKEFGVNLPIGTTYHQPTRFLPQDVGQFIATCDDRLKSLRKLRKYLD